jgi:hypothetical protein
VRVRVAEDDAPQVFRSNVNIDRFRVASSTAVLEDRRRTSSFP